MTEMDRAAETLIRDLIGAARPRRRDPRRGGRRDRRDGRGCAGSWIRWTGPSTTCTGCRTGRSASPPRATARCVAGAVFVPRRDELFSATLGRRGWLRSGRAGGRRARCGCNAGVPLGQALVATGFGYGPAPAPVQGEVLGRVLPRVARHPARRVGRRRPVLGGVGPGGRLLRARRELWDIAAGGLIAAEAGRPGRRAARAGRRARR